MGTFKLNTVNFGEIEVEEDKIIIFSQGIPGFENTNRYMVVQIGDDIPFSYLQSLDYGELAFLITDPFLYYPDYEFQLPDSVIDELKISNEEEVMISSLVSIKDNMEDATINLLAPIVINIKAALGKQVILHNSKYTTKHKLFQTKMKKE